MTMLLEKQELSLGLKAFFWGYFDGTSIIPIDFTIQKEKTLPRKKSNEQYKKEC